MDLRTSFQQTNGNGSLLLPPNRFQSQLLSRRQRNSGNGAATNWTRPRANVSGFFVDENRKKARTDTEVGQFRVSSIPRSDRCQSAAHRCPPARKIDSVSIDSPGSVARHEIPWESKGDSMLSRLLFPSEFLPSFPHRFVFSFFCRPSRSCCSTVVSLTDQHGTFRRIRVLVPHFFGSHISRIYFLLLPPSLSLSQFSVVRDCCLLPPKQAVARSTGSVRQLDKVRPFRDKTRPSGDHFRNDKSCHGMTGYLLFPGFFGWLTSLVPGFVCRDNKAALGTFASFRTVTRIDRFGEGCPNIDTSFIDLINKR